MIKLKNAVFFAQTEQGSIFELAFTQLKAEPDISFADRCQIRRISRKFKELKEDYSKERDGIVKKYANDNKNEEGEFTAIKFEKMSKKDKVAFDKEFKELHNVDIEIDEPKIQMNERYVISELNMEILEDMVSFPDDEPEKPKKKSKKKTK